MTDNPESAREDGEVREQPTSDPSQTDGGQPTSQSLDLTAIVNSLREDDDFVSFVDERAARKAQSQKDRRIDRNEKRLNGFEERLERYEQLRESGMSREQARSQLQHEDDREWLRSYRQQVEERKSSSPQRGEGNSSGVSKSAKAILKQYNVPEDNEDVSKLLVGKTEDEQIATAVQIGMKVQEQESSVTPAMISPPRGGNVPQTDLVREYQEKLIQLQGNRRAIKQLQAEYRKKGIDPTQIGFASR